MSVTFFTDDGGITGWVVTCLCEDGQGVTFPAEAEAEATALADRYRADGTTVPGCVDELCPVYGVQMRAVCANPGPEVNVSSTNAQYLLESLGLAYETSSAAQVARGDYELCGDKDAKSFLDCVQLAQMTAEESPAIPASTMPGPGMTMIDCGRPANYLSERLSELRAVALHAIEVGSPVRWG